MYPLPKTPLPSTSGFVPRPTPTFQPIAPDTLPQTVNTHHTHNPQNTETSPEFTTLWTMDPYGINKH